MTESPSASSGDSLPSFTPGGSLRRVVYRENVPPSTLYQSTNLQSSPLSIPIFQQFDITLEGHQVLPSGSVGFGHKGQCVVYPSELGGLTYLSLVFFLGFFNDCLPDIAGEGLVHVCRGGQLAAYPGF